MRLSHGEPLRTVCRDPHLPSRSTVQAWAQRRPDVARLLDLGRNNAASARADALFKALGGWNYFRPFTPEESAEIARQTQGRRPRLPPDVRAKLKGGGA